MAEEEPHLLRHRLFAAAKLLLVGVVVWFIRGAIVDAWDQLHARVLHVDFGWLSISALLYIAGTALCGLFWHQVLRALGQPVKVADTLRAYYVGHLGKYVPGKAMVVILRVGLLGRQRVDPSLAAVSVFFETLTMMAVGGLMSAVIIAIFLREHTAWFLAAIAMASVSGLPTLPPAFRWLVRLIGVGKRNQEVADRLSGLGYRLAFSGWALTAAGWVLQGASLWAVLRAIGATDGSLLEQLHLCTASVSLATVAGFISFVPGGAGVREAALAESLAFAMPFLTAGTALIAAILLRVISLVAELGLSGILYCVAVFTRCPPPPLPPGP